MAGTVKKKSDSWQGYLFISPWLIGFVIFILIPWIYLKMNYFLYSLCSFRHCRCYCLGLDL